MKLFDTVRRVATSALAHKHEFVLAVMTFAPDHRLVAAVGFAAVLAGWFVGCALYQNRHSLRRMRERMLSGWRFDLFVPYQCQGA